ncbi:3-ketoacyl-acyl carrier protein reductase [Mollisia scopiformis]|uniref:3-ketoacyl-acyl carrier protein reductase n=1 Tax=Mollisia scopiformis TaxID=149040 RepID=A0A194XEE5_MOLSC|nr:3-ketoacyl-acyl carrier protein reductase [Mollisia scopiformis]KUJ18516.1 3-ketoacyl-acyl carrier protein reductase [Mollisia scopiformis]
MADNNIVGRLALITGASSGIGAACARDLAGRGVHLALTYSKNKESMEKIVADIRVSSPEAAKLRLSIHKVDVGVVDEMKNMFKEIQEQHKTHVDILVSNAGYGKRIVDVWDIPLEEFEYTLNVNLRASFVLVKGVVEGMKAQKWGRIIFMSSIAASGGGINGCHYAASKGGLTGMMKNLAAKLALLNISVNDVAPALIGETGMISGPDIIPGGVGTIPLGRLGSPQEVANVVSMLATTGFMTGQSLLIAGGLK